MHVAVAVALGLAPLVVDAGPGAITNDALCDAAQRGNDAQFAKLLGDARKQRNLGDDFLNRRDAYAPEIVAGCTAELGRASMLAAVLADVDATAHATLLDAATCGGAPDVLALLDERKIAPTAQNARGAECLAERGDVAGLARFVDAGVPASALLRVANAAAVRWLVARGADVNHTFDCVEKNGPTSTCSYTLALDVALPFSLQPRAKRPTPKGTARYDVDDAQWTALHVAALRGDVDVVGALIELKANIDAATARGFTPALLAAWAGHQAVLEKLFVAGADKTARAARLGVLHMAALSVTSSPRGTQPRSADDALALLGWLKTQDVIMKAPQHAPLDAVLSETSKHLAESDDEAARARVESIRAVLAGLPALEVK